jgi:hypothetical protein
VCLNAAVVFEIRALSFTWASERPIDVNRRALHCATRLSGLTRSV